MPLSDHPLWKEYKAALVRLTDASPRIEALRGQAERNFKAALRHCDSLREKILKPTRQIWL